MPDETIESPPTTSNEETTADPPASTPDSESQAEVESWRQETTAWMSSIDRRIDGLVEKIDAFIGASSPPATEEKTEIEPATDVNTEQIKHNKRYAGLLW